MHIVILPLTLVFLLCNNGDVDVVVVAFIVSPWTREGCGKFTTYMSKGASQAFVSTRVYELV